MSEKKSEQDVPSNPFQPDVSPDFAASIDENDPHKVEKLANAGKSTDAARESE